jgi:S-adenosylmethionine:tRNA ribosyltransferase-isomerase
VQTADFDYFLPPELIAQYPPLERDQSRLFVLQRRSKQTSHEVFRDLVHHFQPGDALVLNNSRVIPARLRGVNPKTGGHFEILLLEENGINDWWAMMRPGKRAPLGIEIALLNFSGEPTEVKSEVMEINDEGHRRLRFSGTLNINDVLDAFGEMPVPPYINRENRGELETDRTRYQTVYAAPPGSVAAPTAGLHFTAKLLDEIRSLGVQVCFVTLHVGLGTFAPVKAETPADHVMHEEYYDLGGETARLINEAKRAGRRVIAVGTTTVRVLESVAAQNGGNLVSGNGRTRIFICPPYRFQMVDALLTNFHLPRSTLLMLVSAIAAPGETCGRELILSAYAEAVRERYRFFSYGDAMLLL